MSRLSVSSRLAKLSDRQRAKALKRSISRRKVKRVIRRVRPHARQCPVVPDEMVVWLIIGLGLFCGDAARQVWRWLVPASADLSVPRRNTLCMARQRLGTRVMIELAKVVLHPLAGPDTPGACYCGMPLRSIDCVNLSLYDSPENRRVFNPPRPPRRRNRGGRRRPAPAFPQAKLCALAECGTHAVYQWGLKPVHWADSNMAPPLLRHLEKNQLLMWDAAFYSHQNLQQVLEKEAHLLGRLNWTHEPRHIRTLSDGSYLARLTHERGKPGPVVRIIQYTLPGMSCGRHKNHRLLTTLLDEKQHPAQTLAELYHNRWEIELTIDELETHQLQQRVMASQTPAGVVQEVAGLLMAHWLIRQLMFEASAKAQVSPLRISFVGTLKILRCRLGEAGATPASHRAWWKRLIDEVTGEVIEPRRSRTNPRVLKRTTFDFKKKKPGDYNPSPPAKFCDAFAILR